ncbi:hypothetical protein [Fibrella forsythiae]|uniref:DUF4890 domain-containing protein n=1 Tax=Fibrella forsythiae TaxID=2817061 RepID=A0ABS3JHW0_9BACT|nr:hypothetical protein [Fibrella forsythiae]MBO0949587.1 hypothetical protein [Fibrella forsythiae]
MRTRFLAASIIAVFISAGAFAQTEKPHLSKEERVARREEMKAKLAAMSPEERKAFKESQREKLKEKMANMTPDQREKVKERLQAQRERHQAKKNG